MAAGMKIGDLAKEAGCTVETIRYYEQEHLLPEPARSSGNYRIYGPEHLQALRFLRHCRSLDMTHDEMRALAAFRTAPSENCGEVNLLLDQHIGHVAQRIRELRALEKELKALRGKCQAIQGTSECGIMQTLGSAIGAPAVAADGHGKLHRTHR